MARQVLGGFGLAGGELDQRVPREADDERVVTVGGDVRQHDRVGALTRDMVNAVGGVEVCLPKPIDDTKALLHLAAGRQTLNGEQALGYVRARYSLGDGSDIGRIQRQQMFIASMVNKVMSGQTLTNPARLFAFLDAATKSVTTDPDLTPGVLQDLALSARGLSAGGIHFITTPWRYSLSQPGRVEWVQPQAKKLFQVVAGDMDINSSGVKGGNRVVLHGRTLWLMSGRRRAHLSSSLHRETGGCPGLSGLRTCVTREVPDTGCLIQGRHVQGHSSSAYWPGPHGR